MSDWVAGLVPELLALTPIGWVQLAGGVAGLVLSALKFWEYYNHRPRLVVEQNYGTFVVLSSKSGHVKATVDLTITNLSTLPTSIGSALFQFGDLPGPAVFRPAHIYAGNTRCHGLRLDPLETKDVQMTVDSKIYSRRITEFYRDAPVARGMLIMHSTKKEIKLRIVMNNIRRNRRVSRT